MCAVLPTCSHSAGSIEYLKWHRPTHTPLPLLSWTSSISPWSLSLSLSLSLISHLHLSLSLPSATRTLPHTTSLTPQECAFCPYPVSTHPILPRPSDLPASSSVSSTSWPNPLLSASLPCHLLLHPSFFHFPPFIPYKLSTGAIPMDKSEDGLLSTLCSTDQTYADTD